MRSPLPRRGRAAVGVLATLGLAALLGNAGPKRLAADDEPATKTRPARAAAAKLPPARERELRWGEPVGGLRSAVAIRRPADGPKSDEPEFFLVVQNVSEAPVHLDDRTATEQPRRLLIKHLGKIAAAIVTKESTGTDVMLKPREVASLRLFAPELTAQERRTSNAVLAESVLQDKDQTVIVELRIDKAPAGCWTGRLRSGETDGATARAGGGDSGPRKGKPER